MLTKGVAAGGKGSLLSCWLVSTLAFGRLTSKE
jgi:hypothetical protein